MRIDHLIYGVADLDAAVARLADELGLRATGGGEHPEFGTRNEIVPIGGGQYLELMAVADERSQHPLALAVARQVAAGDRLVAVCLRPESLDAVASRLGLAITPGERHNPGGETLRWRLAGVEAAIGPERLPFFIDWQGAEGELDRRNDAAAQADGIAWVEYGGDAARLPEWTGGAELPLRVVEGEPGPQAVALQRGAETVVVR